MDKRLRNSFHLIWLAVIVLCLLASVFVLFFTSCTDGGAKSSAPGEVIISTPEADPAAPAAAAATPDLFASSAPIPTDSPIPEAAG